jgi:hypothetical protein
MKRRWTDEELEEADARARRARASYGKRGGPTRLVHVVVRKTGGAGTQGEGG